MIQYARFGRWVQVVVLLREPGSDSPFMERLGPLLCGWVRKLSPSSGQVEALIGQVGARRRAAGIVVLCVDLAPLRMVVTQIDQHRIFVVGVLRAERDHPRDSNEVAVLIISVPGLQDAGLSDSSGGEHGRIGPHDPTFVPVLRVPVKLAVELLDVAMLVALEDFDAEQLARALVRRIIIVLKLIVVVKWAMC